MACQPFFSRNSRRLWAQKTRKKVLAVVNGEAMPAGWNDSNVV
jgi:hypothetical protein